MYTQKELSEIHRLIGTLSQKLMARNSILATAESCTGGLIAALCTDIPGSSAWFCGSVVAYANEVKEKCLGVPPEILERHGAVSEEVVKAMARGALERLPAQCSIAVSGIAGPDGGSPEKPVGTVWLAVALEDRLRTSLRHFKGGRADIRLQTVEEGVRMLTDFLS